MDQFFPRSLDIFVLMEVLEDDEISAKIGSEWLESKRKKMNHNLLKEETNRRKHCKFDENKKFLS